MIRIVQFDSVGELLDTIDSTRHGKGWVTLSQYDGSTDDDHNSDCGTLDANVVRARSLGGLEEEITLLESLVERLQGTVEAPASIRRVQTWGRSGNTVNVHRVLSGNLSHAWRRTMRQTRPTGGQILTLILPGAFHAGISVSQIRCTMAASLAYAALCEQAGYRCEIWHVNTAKDTYPPDDSCIATCIKRADAPWSVQNAALAATPGWLRKLYFRIMELGEVKGYGKRRPGYGFPLQGEDMQALARTWATHAGITTPLRYGATQDDAITSEARAAAWIQAQLEQQAA